MGEYINDFTTKDEMIEKLRNLVNVPDDDNIRIKNKIKEVLFHCPQLLYCLHEEKFESELFDKNGNINVDEDGEPLGDWDLYFGENSNIRDFLCIPDVQIDAKSIVCYQTSFAELPKYNTVEKYQLITFTVMVYATDNIDKVTGIARHDLISSIIREQFAWKNHFGAQCKLISNKETTTDTNYVTRTLTFQSILPNSLVQTDKNGNTSYINKKGLRV